MPPTDPESWRDYLEERLATQQREIKLYEQYYDGEHRLSFATTKYRQAFGSLFKAFADNWTQIVVDAPVERLFIEGFRFNGSEKPSDRAWEIWQASSLDADSIMGHTEAVKSGTAFLLVDPEGSEGLPRITVEHPEQVVVALEGGNRRNRLAALKKWHDDSDGFEYATLYLPERVVKWRSEKPAERVVTGQKVKWAPRPNDEGGENPLGVVPVIPLYNNPTMLGGGRSDLETVIPIQDAINKELADMLVASEYAAFMQRWATGIEVPTDDDGQPLPTIELKSALSGMLAVADKDAKFGQFQASDLGNYVKAVTVLLQHLAAQTRTPPHYLLGEIVNASGDALKAAETGLVAKVKRKQVDFSESWEEAMRLAFKALGEKEAAENTSAETIWRDPEYRSEGEQVDAAIKLKALQIPLSPLWERIGATQAQIAQWQTELPEPVEEKVTINERTQQ